MTLLAEIDAFIGKTGMSATAFGKAAVGDPNFVRDLRGGREPRSRLVQRAQAFISSHQVSPDTAPDGAVDGTPRTRKVLLNMPEKVGS